MKKRFYSALLASALAIPTFIPMTGLNITAQEMVMAEADSEELVYSHDETVEVSNGTGALVLNTEDTAKLAALNNVTFEATVKSSTTGLQTLFFLGDSTHKAHYVSVYINNGSRLGIECQDTKNNSGSVYHIYKDLSGVSFTDEHLIAVTFEGKSKVVFYVDGEKVHEATVAKNFMNDTLTGVNYVGFGNGSRASGGNNYPMSGYLKNIRIYSTARTADQVIADQLGGLASSVYSTSGLFSAQDKTSYTTEAEKINSIKDMTEGSWSARFRMDGTKTDGLQYLATLSDNTATRNFISLYLMKENGVWKTGIDAPDKNISSKIDIPEAYDVTDGHWHDLLAVREGTSWTFYLDGNAIGNATTTDTGMFSKITSPNHLATGFASKANGVNPNEFHGSIAEMNIYTSKLNSLEAKTASNPIQSTGETTPDLSDVYLTEPVQLFGPGYDNSAAYRIPSMITTSEGTVLVGIDKRNSGFADQGNIDFVIRRKEANETEFDEPIVVSDMLDGGAGKKSAVMIDSILLQDTNPDSPHKGRIHAVMDMFTQSNAAMELGNQAVGTEYLTIGENKYRKVYKDGEEQPYAVVEEDGIGVVYTTVTSNNETVLGEKTDYTVTLHAPAPFTQIGNLYKSGEYKGNIFMNEAGSDKGELHMKKTMSIWHFYSDDDGKTWSEPTDLTPMVKKEWMRFCGTGPGRGVQLQNGRLVFPMYSCNSVGMASQSSAIFVSDDWGDTWELKPSPNTVIGLDRETMTSGTIFTEAQPVQLRNGDLLLFMRTQTGKVKYGVSKDNGESWESIETVDIPAVYCQYSAITYVDKDDNEYVIVANPTGPARTHGTITRGKVLSDGTIDWELDQSKLIEPRGYAYSCLTEIAPAEDGTKRFADFYELDNNPLTLVYVEFDENYMTCKNIPVEETVPALEDLNAELLENGKIRVSAVPTQRLFSAGTPSLQILCNQQTVSLPVVSSTATEVVFEGTLPENFNGVVKAKGMSYETGELSNMNGLKAEVKEQDLLDTTVIYPVSVVSYTSQYSDSTAENTDGAASNIIDGNPNTHWHSHYTASLVMPQQVTFDFGEEVTINQMNFLNRQTSTNAICKDFRLEGSTDGVNFSLILDSELANTSQWQSVPFKDTTLRYVRFSEDSNYSDNKWATIAEMNFNIAVEGVSRVADKTALNKMIEKCKALENEKNTDASWEEFKTVIETAEALAADTSASQSSVDAMIGTLRTESRNLADKSALETDLTEYAALDAKDYDPATWNAFKEELDAVTKDLNTYTSQREVENKIMSLKHLYSQLEAPKAPVVLDYTLLDLAIAKADELGDLTAFSNGSTLTPAVNDARTVKTNAKTHDEINAAASKLNDALLALRKTPSSDALKEIAE